MVASLRFATSLGLLALSSCSGQRAPEAARAQEPPPPPLALMNATVLVKSCPNVTTANAHKAEQVLRTMLEPCTKVPSGNAHFTATMMPGGRIELGSPEGDPTEGVIPTCAVKNQLSHTIYLRKPCAFHVLLEERHVTPEPAAPR
jgi:hypothetical protein